MRNTAITIHLDNIHHNISTMKAYAPTAKLLAMVKADAYGHQVGSVLPAMADADGFGVACMAEALAVKAAMANDDKRPVVLIEGVFGADEWQLAIQHNLMSLIHHQSQLDYALSQKPPTDSLTTTVWLKYNTGMNRLGFGADDTIIACDKLIACGYKIILTSHFACADDIDHPMNTIQCQRFDAMLTKLQQKHGNLVQGSLCNSAGIVHFNHHHYHWVRSGIALYGSSPIAQQSAQILNLKPAMRLCAQIMAIHHLGDDDFVGYGALWGGKVATIGIVSIGYGDGYPRVVEGAYVGIQGNRYPIVGRVAMDMLAVDITGGDIAIGDCVVLWGDAAANEPTVDDVATWAKTIGYELLCRLTQRPNRLVD